MGALVRLFNGTMAFDARKILGIFSILRNVKRLNPHLLVQLLFPLQALGFAEVTVL